MKQGLYWEVERNGDIYGRNCSVYSTGIFYRTKIKWGAYDVFYGILSSTYCRRVFVWVAP